MTWKNSGAFLAVLLLGAGCDWSRIDDWIEGAGGRGGGHRPDASPPVPDGGGGACWASRLPDVQPTPPRGPAAEACAQAGLVAWKEPDRGTEPSTDARGLLVGRWIPCAAGGLGLAPHDGIEFGANGRWRLLARNTAGALVSAGDALPGNTGRYYALSRGQLNLSSEDPGSGAPVSFAYDPRGTLLRFENLPGGVPDLIYARTDASPRNGRDNVPSISDGRCTLIGDWDLPATASSSAASFSFDAAGNFVGGPSGSDLCAAHTMYGTYRLSPGLFQLTENVGLGSCDWWFDASYRATFDGQCTRLTLVESHDNCTGGRGYFNGQTVLTRRR